MVYKKINPKTDLIFLGVVSIMVGGSTFWLLRFLGAPNFFIIIIWVVLFFSIILFGIVLVYRLRINIFGSIYPGRVNEKESKRIVDKIDRYCIYLLFLSPVGFLVPSLVTHNIAIFLTWIFLWIFLIPVGFLMRLAIFGVIKKVYENKNE